MGNLASVLVPLGAQALGSQASGNAKPTTSGAVLNTSGSAYTLNSNNQAAALIQNGVSTTQLLIIGGGILLAVLLLGK